MKPTKEELKHYKEIGLTMFEIAQLHHVGYSSIQGLSKQYEIIFNMFRICDQDDVIFRKSFLIKKGFTAAQAKRMTDKKIQPSKEVVGLKKPIRFDQIGCLNYIVKNNSLLTSNWKKGAFDNVQIR